MLRSRAFPTAGLGAVAHPRWCVLAARTLCGQGLGVQAAKRKLYFKMTPSSRGRLPAAASRTPENSFLSSPAAPQRLVSSSIHSAARETCAACKGLSAGLRICCQSWPSASRMPAQSPQGFQMHCCALGLSFDTWSTYKCPPPNMGREPGARPCCAAAPSPLPASAQSRTRAGVVWLHGPCVGRAWAYRRRRENYISKMTPSSRGRLPAAASRTPEKSFLSSPAAPQRLVSSSIHSAARETCAACKGLSAGLRICCQSWPSASRMPAQSPQGFQMHCQAHLLRVLRSSSDPWCTIAHQPMRARARSTALLRSRAFPTAGLGAVAHPRRCGLAARTLCGQGLGVLAAKRKLYFKMHHQRGEDCPPQRRARLRTVSLPALLRRSG